jgi:hypothetical protein
MQGLSDASMHYGWVQDYQNNLLSLEVSSKRQLNKGDFLFIEISASNRLLTFVAYIIHLQGDTIMLQVSSPIEDRGLKSESRLRVEPISASLVQNGIPHSVTVVDISDNGLGFITEDPIITSGLCEGVLFTPHGSVTVSLNVRHMRNDREEMVRRGGAQVLEIDRVSKARWSRLFVE